MPKGWKGSVVDYCVCCGNEIVGKVGKGNTPLWCEDCVDHLDGKGQVWKETWYALYHEECPNAEVVT